MARAQSGLLAELKAWFWERDGFATETFAFAAQHAGFFEPEVEEHSLQVTALYQEFRTYVEATVEAFLQARGSTLQDLEALLTAEGTDEETDVMLDVLLGML